jgi:prepilin-type N-terminal cleavage/methylation domain-containing protein
MNDAKVQKGFSLIELLIVVAIILIIAAIAIPNLLRSKMAANEASAVGSLRTINTAQVSYATAYPSLGYAQTLGVLGGTATVCATATGATQTNACLIDNILATATGAGTAKSGYIFTWVGNNLIGTVNTAYSLNAPPANPGTTGQRFFFTDQTGVIRYGLTSQSNNASSAIQ